MSIRSVLVLLLALVFGGSAAVGVNALRTPPPAEEAAPPAPPPPETVPVVVAAVDVPRFTTLSADMLKTREYPKDLAPSGAVAHAPDLTDRVVLSSLAKDEPVLDSKVAARGSGHGMAPGIPKGMRAFTIQTSHVSAGVAGFILPGNKVDVLLTTNPPGGQNDPTGGGSTLTLLQGVEVLAVDQNVDAPASNKVDPNLRSVTMLVTPEQMVKLDLGQVKGTLHLALRNTEDASAAPPNRVTLSQIEGLPEPPREAVKEKEPEKVTPAAATQPSRPARIRTLHGVHEGVIELD